MKILLKRITESAKRVIDARLFHSFLLVAIGGIFLFSGINKALALNDFIDIVLSYDLLPDGLARAYGYFLPFAEIIIGILLLLRIAPRLAALITIPIILSFIIANSYVLSTGRQNWEGSCGCFGELPFTHTQSLILGIIMLIMTAILLKQELGSLERISILPRKYGVMSLTGLACAALVFSYVSDPISTESISGIQEGDATTNIQNEITSEIDASLENNKPAFVFFYSEGCPFCEQQKPIVDELQGEVGDYITFIRVNFEQYYEMARDLGVNVTPTILLIHEKNEQGAYKYLMFNNLTTKETLLERMADYLPADTTSPAITGISVSAITDTSATISWTTNESAASNIEYGPDTGYGYSFPSPSDTTADKTSHSLTLTGLSPETTYHFRVKSEDKAGNEAVSGDYNFTTERDTTAPEIMDVTVSDITDDAVTISWTTDEPATSNIEYGLDTNYGSSYPSTSDNTADKTSHSLTLSGLSSESEYHFRINSADINGNEAVSKDYQFNLSLAPDTTAPEITDIVVSGVTANSATFSWNTDEPATGNIEYGPGYSYSFPSPADTKADTYSHSVTLSGLSPDTVYDLRIKSADNAGNEAVENYTFSTTPVFAVETKPATHVCSPDGDRYIADVNGNLLSLGEATSVSVYFQFGTSTNYNLMSTPITMTAAGSFMSTFGTGGIIKIGEESFNDPTLEAGRTYHFRAVAEMNNGTKVYGADMTFFTEPYPNPPGQIVQSLNLTQAYDMYVANLGNEDFVILQNESYHEEDLHILGTSMNLSPWCAACMWELHELDRSKTYFLYSGIGAEGENSYNSEVMSQYMKNMGFENVYFLSPATVSDWADAGYPIS